MIKRILAALIAFSFLFVLAIGVSADYVTLYDWGLGYTSSASSTANITYMESGYGNDYNVFYLLPYWALDSFNPDYTYTCNFSFNTISDISLSTNSTYPIAFFNKNKITTNVPTNSSKALSTVKITPTNDEFGTKRVEITVKFNPTFCGLDYFPVYVYCKIAMSNLQQIRQNGWGVSCEYDPGGSKYIEEYLDQIVNAGSGYPVPDGSTLDSSVNSLNSAEGVVKDKSSSLINSVSSEMSDNLSQAKALSTTLKPAAVQINNIYNSFLSVLPAEVKAVFIAVPLLLFVGWLVGRIKE